MDPKKKEALKFAAPYFALAFVLVLFGSYIMDRESQLSNIEQCNNTLVPNIISSPWVCPEPVKCSDTILCKIPEPCPVCLKPEPLECPSAEDEVIIIRGINDYERGLLYQEEANRTLEDLKHYMFYKEYANCSRIIGDTIEHLGTASAFYNLAAKKFITLSNIQVAAAYHNGTLAYVNYNNDYIEYLTVHRTYCNNHIDNEDYSNNDFMQDNGDKWLNRSAVHWREYEYNLRLVEELRQ